MKFKMSEKSLFAALLRAPWWVSFLVMLAVALVAGALLPDAYKTAGMLGAFPFLVIGVMAAWRQRNAISASRIQELLEQARGMGWRDFSVLVEEALRQQGFVVARLTDGPADFQIEKNGRVTLVSAKRWKAATVGAEHLRELLAARESRDAFSCTCMSLGIFSQAAIDLANNSPMQLLGSANIAQLMHDGAKALKP
ncbi:restriction endonuclease [uncultured Limnohabitans sp.]|jgi:restriction system protein|uniref:restriction endonuclease n=1 Tax=uncultured Limnohabitans sp. TaxID=768543 RepID=UPI001B407B40|nr:restriction endonuclease [uncultured Limnohabitans sp.]MBP6220835.1 restriction endonuclease [Limnohabitans sp.]MBP6246190.1 restriction endonuclease [Limnohabitans sp.]